MMVGVVRPQQSQLARALLSQSLQPRRIDHPAQGFAQLAQALAARKVMGEEQERTSGDNQAIGRALLTSAQGVPAFNDPDGGAELVGAIPPGVQALGASLRTQGREDLATPRNLAIAAQLQGQQAEGFTLGAGQTRFDAGGNQIAAGPEKAQPGFSLTPGGARFDAEGNVVAERAPAPPKPTRRDNEIEALIARGFSEADSQDITDGNVRVIADPLTGQNRLVNIATQTEIALPGGGQAAQPEQQDQPSRKTVFETIGKGVGLISVAKAFGSGITGQFSDSAIAEGEVQAKSILAKLSQQVRAAFALSDRPSVFEQKLILENVPGGILEAEGTAIIKLETLRDQVRSVLADDLAYAKRTDIPPEGRAAALARARGLESVLETLGERLPAKPGGTGAPGVRGMTDKELFQELGIE